MIVRKFYKPHLMIQIYGVPLKMMWKNFILAAIGQGKRDKEQIIKMSVGNEQNSVASQHTTFTNMLSGHRWHHQVCKIIDTELLSRKTLAMALAGRSLTLPPSSHTQKLLTLWEISDRPPTSPSSCTTSWVLEPRVGAEKYYAFISSP